MRFSKTTIRELGARYKEILKKCFIINMALFLGATTVQAATVYQEGMGAPITGSAADTPNPTTDNYRLLGGWFANSSGKDAALAGNGFNSDISVTGGKWKYVFGGNYVSAVDGTFSMGDSRVVIDGQDTDIYHLIGGMGSYSEANTNVLSGGSSTVIINNGHFGLKQPLTTNVLEQVITAGDMVKGAFNATSTVTRKNAHLVISGGTFDGAVVGGSIANSYYGNTGTLKAHVDTALMDITGGTFNEVIVAGGMAYSGIHRASEGWGGDISTVGTSTLNISNDTGTLVINNNIHTGTLFGIKPTNQDSTIDQVFLNVKNATVQGIYDTDVKVALNVSTSGVPEADNYWVFTPDTETSSSKNTTATLTDVIAKGDILINTGSLTMTNVTAEKDVTLKNGTLNLTDVTAKNITHESGDATLNTVTADTVTLGGTNSTLSNTTVTTMTLNNGTANFADNVNVNNMQINGGKLIVDGLLTIEDAITGTGNVVFNEGSSLKAALNSSTALISADTIEGTTAFVFDTDSNGGTLKVDAQTKNTLTFADNVLFATDSQTEDTVTTYTFTKKSSEAATESLIQEGVGTNEATAIGVIANTEATGNTTVDTVLNTITTAVQTGDMATAESVVQQINPVVAPVTQAVSTNVAVLGAAMTRMANLSIASTPTTVAGRSGGDGHTSKLSPWIQGMYSKTHNSQGIGFDAYSQGFAFGADTNVTEDWTLGIGYAYTATDIKDSVRKTQAYGDNVFAYAQYKPADWYINGTLNYGHTKYKEKSALVGADYSIDTYGAQIMAGHEWDIFNNYAGVRYTYVDMDKYTNGVTEIDTKDAQVATAVIGTKVSKDFALSKKAILTPEFRLAGTYDFKSDNSSTNVGIVGTQSMYTVNGKRLSRAAIETGVGLTASIHNWELSLNYDASLRSENNTQSGMFKLKYNF